MLVTLSGVKHLFELTARIRSSYFSNFDQLLVAYDRDIFFFPKKKERKKRELFVIPDTQIVKARGLWHEQSVTSHLLYSARSLRSIRGNFHC